MGILSNRKTCSQMWALFPKVQVKQCSAQEGPRGMRMEMKSTGSFVQIPLARTVPLGLWGGTRTAL